MGMKIPVSLGGWAKEEKEIHNRISVLKNKSEAFKSLATDIEYDEDPSVQTKCKLARRIFEESLDMFEDGDMEWDGFIADLVKSLKAIGTVKPIKMAQEDEPEEIGK